MGSNEIGLYDVGKEPGLFGFMILLITDIFQLFAKYPRSKEALYKIVRISYNFGEPIFKC